MRILIVGLMTGLLVACATAPAPRETTASPLPDSYEGRLAMEWLDAINSGSAGSLERFVNSRFSEQALSEQSAEDRVRFMRTLQLQSGGLDAVEVSAPVGELPLSMLVKTRRGDRYARVMMGLRDGQLMGLGVGPSDAPAPVRRHRWPASPRSDQERIEAIRQELDRRTAEGSFSGVLLIARGDEILLHEARGFADRDQGIQNRTTTRFHLASVGKLFTAAAIGQLIDEGKFSWATTVGEILPDYPDRTAAERITIDHLLTHTSGLGTFFNSPGYEPGRVYATATEQLEVFRDEPLLFEPGSRWRYSNAGFAVLEAIIEQSSGVRFGDYLERRIFEPHRMTRTNDDVSTMQAPDVSRFYTPAPDDPLALESPIESHGWRERRPTGFGEGYSTAEDLFRFSRALVAGSIVSPATLQSMFDRNVDIGRGEVNLRGLRERTVNGKTVRGHTGGGRADVVMIPDGDYTVIVLTNLSPPSASTFGADITEFLTRDLAR